MKNYEMSFDQTIFRRNDEAKRYELEYEGITAFIDFKKNASSRRIYLVHTEVPEEFRNQGLAEKLVLKSLNDVKDMGWDLMPLCPYIVTYLKRHPEWVDIVDESTKQKFL